MANTTYAIPFAYGKPKKVLVYNGSHLESGDTPLFMLDNEISSSFLLEEVGGLMGNIGNTFVVSDLAQLWHTPKLINAVLKHPSSLREIKRACQSRGIKIESVKVNDVLDCLEITKAFFWEENIETMEDLLIRKDFLHICNDEIIRNDICSALLSKYGLSLLPVSA